MGLGYYGPRKFGWVLLMNFLWRILTEYGIFHWIVKDKYMMNWPMLTWIKDISRFPYAVSYILKIMMNVRQWLLNNIKWQVGNVTIVEICLDPIF